MSTTKRLSVKAVKPQDQTSASQAQALIDHILDEKTTELSDAVDSAVYSSIINGTGMVQMGMRAGAITATGGPYALSSDNINAARIHASIPGLYPRPIDLKREMLEEHPAFELTVEQLRAEIGRAHV